MEEVTGFVHQDGLLFELTVYFIIELLPALPDHAFCPQTLSLEITGQLKSSLAENRKRYHRVGWEADDALRSMDAGKRETLADHEFLDFKKNFLTNK